MCGRYVSPDQAAIERMWHIGRHNTKNPIRQRYNVLPTTPVAIIRRAADADEHELTEARWGLIPHWWAQPKMPTSTINARSEEAAGKPMWRHPYRNARCLIPALGWYEWKPIHKVWGRLRRKAGLPHLRIHDLRHQYASFLVNSGRTLYEVQQILGHSDPIVTQRYAHLSSMSLQDAANSASVIIKGAMPAASAVPASQEPA